jgi:hypothetical protein
MRFLNYGLLWVLLFIIGAVYAQNASYDCSVDSLPKDISKALRTSFGGWRIQTVKDLDPYDQKLWKSKRLNECPGIANGNFFNRGNQAFALLLVPASVTGFTGYKLIAFSRSDKNGHFFSTVIEDVKNQDSLNLAISRVPPGVYKEPEETKSIQIKTDGIQIEKIEVTTKVYFWRNNHFEYMITSY